MRVIKFRGKRKPDGRWVHGAYIPYGHYIKEQGRNHPYTAVDPATVGQYTGWKDKHDEEIYEGDLLRFTLQLPEDLEEEITKNDLIFQVFWTDNGFYIARPYVNYMDDPQNPHGTLDMYEIIGNIHEGRQKNNG